MKFSFAVSLTLATREAHRQGVNGCSPRAHLERPAGEALDQSEMKRDPKTGDEIWPDPFGSEPEDIAAYRALETACGEAGWLVYERDASGEIVKDERGCNVWRLNIPPPEAAPPPPHERTLADVGGLDMDDDFDRAMASLPIYSALLDKAKAALRANISGPVIQARLRCSNSLTSRARAELREELPEHEWPLSISRPKAHSRQANLSRPNMSRASGNNPLQLRARNLGVTEAEANQIAIDSRNRRKFKERPDDLQPKRKGKT